MVKNPPVDAGDIRDAGSVPGLGRSPGERNGNPLQYSCLEKPMDRGDWKATVHRVAKSRTQLKRVSTHTRRSNWSILKEINPKYSLEGLMLKLKLQYLAT